MRRLSWKILSHRHYALTRQLPPNNISRMEITGEVAARCTYPGRDHTMSQCAALIAIPGTFTLSQDPEGEREHT